jgi:hypothetical protein
MQYLGTAFTLTLGAWRIRFSLFLEDAPDDRTAAMAHVHQHADRARVTSR